MHPLVLLPGMNCTADLWTGTGLEPAIAPALDRPDMSEQVEALLADLPDRFVLVGLSLGAIVAMALAQAAPRRVAGLCVMSTNAKQPTPAQRDGWQDWLDRIDRGESARELQRSILNGLLSKEGRERVDAVDRTLEMGERTGEQRLQAQLRMQQTRRDLRPGLDELTMPVLVIGGQQDAICPPSFHAEIASAVPNARYVSTDGGHLLPLERPETVGSLISDWRAQHRI
ncbi:alpha/beta hydrolase [Microbacterium sp.]|uniref:alpha/beta fold hydrolase n=1 Tax=Microbacterium sp. TaxID=51671 RepID=UPI002811FC3E|nr:alpha/beta hydrolase [Microbacterium sp.]